MSRTPALLVLTAALVAAAPAARAETFGRPVFVTAPIGAGSSLAAARRVDADARQALVDAYVRDRISPVLLDRRGDDVRAVLESPADVLQGFRVISRTTGSDGRVRVVCEADIDASAIAMRLVQNGVLSFKRQKPRLLLVAAPGTATATFQAVRAQMTETLRGTGIEVLAAENVMPVESVVATVSAIAVGSRETLARAALDAGAHFVALLAVSAAPAQAGRSAVVILDGSIRFTLLRMYDAAVLGEAAMSAREGAGSPEMAMGRVVAQIAPPLSRALAGSVAAAVFANGRVIDGSQPPAIVTINVMRRPSAGATTALIGLLREHGYNPQLGPGRAAGGGSTPADRLTIDGIVSVDELFALLADSSFGPSGVLSAAVLEHGNDTLGIDIVDARQPPPAPPATLAVDATATLTATTTAAESPAENPARLQPAAATGGVTAPALTPTERSAASPRPTAAPSEGSRTAAAAGGATTTIARGSVSASATVAMRTPTPLEFEFSAAFDEAMKAGRVVAR